VPRPSDRRVHFFGDKIVTWVTVLFYEKPLAHGEKEQQRWTVQKGIKQCSHSPTGWARWPTKDGLNTKGDDWDVEDDVNLGDSDSVGSSKDDEVETSESDSGSSSSESEQPSGSTLKEQLARGTAQVEEALRDLSEDEFTEADYF
jgi:hypothetical protein